MASAEHGARCHHGERGAQGEQLEQMTQMEQVRQEIRENGPLPGFVTSGCNQRCRDGPVALSRPRRAALWGPPLC